MDIFNSSEMGTFLPLVICEMTSRLLRFGKRAKNICNKARINAELSLAELKLMLSKAQHEIVVLKNQVEWT